RFLEDVPREHVVETDVFGQELTGPQAHSKFARDVWRPPAAAQPSARSGDGLARVPVFRGGERVRRPKLGTAPDVGVTGEGARTEITVVFESAGAKRLRLKYASLARA